MVDKIILSKSKYMMFLKHPAWLWLKKHDKKKLPEHADFMESVNERIVDLMIPVSKGWYVDKDFMGSASIKSVMPVLVPKLSYKELDIQEGSSAQRVWMETILDEKNKDQKDKILDNLLKYCELDTLAMVEIFNTLRKL